MSQIDETVQNLYAVFGSYRLDHRVEGCLHCVSESEQLELARKPLRQLTCRDLSRYSYMAMTLWGSDTDFKHFLPRLFELLATDPEATAEFETEVLLGKLHKADWLAWPQTERDAINAYLSALWDETLATRSLLRQANDVLSGLVLTDCNLPPFLTHWLAVRTEAAAMNLADFLQKQISSMLKKGKLNLPPVPDHQEATLETWLRSTELRDHLEELFFQHAQNSVVAEYLSDTIEMLRVLHLTGN